MDRDRIALLADGHLTSGDPGRLDNLLRVLEGLERRCAAVCILGDLFEVWLGARARAPHVERLARTLTWLRERGVRTVYVEGNRDFRIGRGATAGLFDAVAPNELWERFGECTYHLSHGDLVNPRDRPYRIWRRFAKGLLAPAALKILPDRLALGIASRLEVGLRSTNRRHKSSFPAEDCVAYARARVAAGADVVAVGHFHRRAVIPVEAGGRRGTFVSLPFWHEEPVPVLFDRAGRLVEEADQERLTP